MQRRTFRSHFFLNAAFVVIELVGGLLTNNIAILTDALHDFGDCLSLAIAWMLQKKSTQGRTSTYTYGYKRFSLLGSVFLSGVLAISSTIVLLEAGQRLLNPQPVNAQGMLWVAVIGILINGGAAFNLKKGSSLNERALSPYHGRRAGMGFRTDCQHCHAFHRPSDARHPAFHGNFHLGADQRLEKSACSVQDHASVRSRRYPGG